MKAFMAYMYFYPDQTNLFEIVPNDIKRIEIVRCVTEINLIRY